MARLREGGARRADAADGGGLSVLLFLGRGRRELVCGLVDGGRRSFDGRCDSGRLLEIGREGGGIMDRSICVFDFVGDRETCAVCPWVLGLRWTSFG